MYVTLFHIFFKWIHIRFTWLQYFKKEIIVRAFSYKICEVLVGLSFYLYFVYFKIIKNTLSRNILLVYFVVVFLNITRLIFLKPVMAHFRFKSSDDVKNYVGIVRLKVKALLNLRKFCTDVELVEEVPF